MDLLTSAIESIKVGVQDYQAATLPRLLSAVRNIHAGIVLLYKEALRRRSPEGTSEVLVKSKILPRESNDGNLEFIGVGRKTVDVQQIRERFNSLNIATNWARFEAISKIRNEIEHYYTATSQNALQGVIADAFSIVRTFVAAELDDDPLELLGEATWRVMLAVTEIYEAERQECRAAIDAIDWRSVVVSRGIQELACNQCGSKLLAPSEPAATYERAILQCRACGAEESSDTFIPRAVQTGLKFDMYLVVDDGADLPYVRCPECGLESYVVEEQRCGWCGHKAVHECARCANPIPPEEIESSPYCGWCAHMMAKDD